MAVIILVGPYCVSVWPCLSNRLSKDGFRPPRTWGNLIYTLLSGKSQSEKAAYCQSTDLTFWER